MEQKFIDISNNLQRQGVPMSANDVRKYFDQAKSDVIEILKEKGFSGEMSSSFVDGIIVRSLMMDVARIEKNFTDELMGKSNPVGVINNYHPNISPLPDLSHLGFNKLFS